MQEKFCEGFFVLFCLSLLPREKNEPQVRKLESES